MSYRTAYSDLTTQTRALPMAIPPDRFQHALTA